MGERERGWGGQTETDVPQERPARRGDRVRGSRVVAVLKVILKKDP